jgi:7-cyano-7-deazaguanine reductase
MKVPELTFMGDKDKPDFASLYLTFYPGASVIELKSLKEYDYEFRNQLYSYERIINVIYDDLMAVYKPKRLRLVLVTNPRGGISSRLCVDSDWSIRGGEELFSDWSVQRDEW